MEPESTAGDTGFNLDPSMDAIAAEITSKGDSSPEPTTTAEPSQATTTDSTQTAAPTAATTTTPTTREPPKSWSKDKHELWSKLPPDAQDYYEQRERQFLDGLEQYKGDAGMARQMRDVLNPYKPLLAAQGLNEVQVIQQVMNAHYRLTNGTPEERAAAYRQIGQEFGLVQPEDGGNADPQMQALNRQIQSVQSRLDAQQRAEETQRRQAVEGELSAFAADAANVYFNDVAQDMVPLVKSGLSLKDAYDRAVWANPVTRQKEQAKAIEKASAELRERAKAEAEAAKKAAGVNVRDAASQKAPTEPKGTMDETMRETLKKIRARA